MSSARGLLLPTRVPRKAFVRRKERTPLFGFRIEKGSGHILLTIIDDVDWSDEGRHLLALPEKLNTYLAFIESGEVFERLVEEAGRTVPRSTPIKVKILARYPVPETAMTFIEHAQFIFIDAGFGLTLKVVAG
jgi:hypothetical protein